tara:strand:+ start:658 stop:1542 length:885 start_codon:yes stop_codon:yes gene_type:complete
MQKTKGIILAGGYGSRLYPLTYGVSKQLIPVYDKPMIYYPLSILLMAGIKDILIITKIEDKSSFRKLLGDGKKYGINIEYAVQEIPGGIAEALIIGANFIDKYNVCLILGDNIFHGNKMKLFLRDALNNFADGLSTIFGIKVNNPSEFGVVELNSENEIISIIEKPINPKSEIIVSGLYFYPNSVLKILSDLKPSKRGELEITDINSYYLNKKKLKMIDLTNDVTWVDTGTYKSLIDASNYFQKFEESSGIKVACIEELVYKMGYIKKEQLIVLANEMKSSEYGKYLLNTLNND